MLTPENDVSVARCMNLRSLIAEKREQIAELEQKIEPLSPSARAFGVFGLPGGVTESQKQLADTQLELEIAQRELQDLLNDYEFSECDRFLSSTP